jgi:uncharacterized protein YndB with AHSA1/START domain
MPTVRRSRTVPASPSAVWEIVADPTQLSRWWPGVQRVEDASRAEWTLVLESSKGRPVRADYTRVRAQRPRRLHWRQEVDETPFEGFLAAAETEVSLEPREEGRATRVVLESRERLRGVSALGGLMVRRATRRRLDGALEGLARLTAPAGDDGGEPA